ncbi:MAG: hypothetical protein LBC61_05770 [Candidatus Peribacteria bacterium]|nr:hypothetical protein [Candidatus Peribacteria bacterium]
MINNFVPDKVIISASFQYIFIVSFNLFSCLSDTIIFEVGIISFSFLSITSLYELNVHNVTSQSQFQVVGFFTSIFQTNGFKNFKAKSFKVTLVHHKLKFISHSVVSNGVTDLI